MSKRKRRRARVLVAALSAVGAVCTTMAAVLPSTILSGVAILAWLAALYTRGLTSQRNPCYGMGFFMYCNRHG